MASFHVPFRFFFAFVLPTPPKFVNFQFQPEITFSNYLEDELSKHGN